MCTAATYILIRVLGYMMKDQDVCAEYMWEGEALMVTMVKAVMSLLFK